jgi:hypothetical protein
LLLLSVPQSQLLLVLVVRHNHRVLRKAILALIQVLLVDQP